MHAGRIYGNSFHIYDYAICIVLWHDDCVIYGETQQRTSHWNTHRSHIAHWHAAQLHHRFCLARNFRFDHILAHSLMKMHAYACQNAKNHIFLASLHREKTFNFCFYCHLFDSMHANFSCALNAFSPFPFLAAHVWANIVISLLLPRHHHCQRTTRKISIVVRISLFCFIFFWNHCLFVFSSLQIEPYDSIVAVVTLCCYCCCLVCFYYSCSSHRLALSVCCTGLISAMSSMEKMVTIEIEWKV